MRRNVSALEGTWKMRGKQRRDEAGRREKQVAASTESGDTRGQSVTFNEPAEPRNKFCHNECIMLQKGTSVVDEAKQLRLKRKVDLTTYLQLTWRPAASGGALRSVLSLCVCALEGSGVHIIPACDESHRDTCNCRKTTKSPACSVSVGRDLKSAGRI